MEGGVTGFDALPAYSAQPFGPAVASPNPQMDYYPPMTSFKTLQLRRVSSSVETFYVEQGDPYATGYSIKVRNSTNFLKKPDLVITREQNQLSTKVGEGRFEKYSAVTTLKYPESGVAQDLQLESHQSQRFAVNVNGKPCWWWQPSKVSKYRAEMVTPSNRLLAELTYSGEHTFMGRDVTDGAVLGTLKVSEEAFEQGVLDQVVCITAVLVERAKRRGRILKGADGGAPMTGLGTVVMG